MMINAPNESVKTNTVHIILLKSVMMPLALVLMTIACVSSGQLMTLNLSEDNLNLIIGNPSINLKEGIVLTVDNIDIQDETIRVFSTIKVDGQSENKGFFDLNLKISEGRIVSDIVNMDFSDSVIPRESIELTGDFFENELNRYVERGNQRVEFEEIHYVPDAIQFRFRIPFAPTPTIFE